MYDCIFGIFTSDIRDKGVLSTTVPMKDEYRENMFFEHEDFPGIKFYLGSFNETEAHIISKDLVPTNYLTDKMKNVTYEILHP